MVTTLSASRNALDALAATLMVAADTAHHAMKVLSVRQKPGNVNALKHKSVANHAAYRIRGVTIPAFA